MTDKVFIDSNIWVYLFSDDKNHKAKIAEKFIADNSVNSVFRYRDRQAQAAVLRRTARLVAAVHSSLREDAREFCVSRGLL